MIPPCVYDPINRELRTVPAFFNDGAVYAGFVRAPGIAIGTAVAPGRVLGVLHWDNKTSVVLVAPEGCHGRIQGFGDLDEYRIHRGPSQVLLTLRPCQDAALGRSEAHG